MNSRICSNCQNKKPINNTSNRLVIEHCGHTKCMDCLIQEKFGCVACIKEGRLNEVQDIVVNEKTEVIKCEPIVSNHLDESDVKTIEIELDPIDTNKKEKPETSHIQLDIDTNGEKCYVCTVCKKRFHARSQVAYHAYCNGQRKPYHCHECAKSFATYSHFKYHMRVHRNERSYACEVCGDSFFQVSKLQRHKLKHTKEKKYPCTQCNKAFNNLSSLRKHWLTHTEERPYSCTTCGRCFRDSSNYRKHVAKHINNGKVLGGEGVVCVCAGCSIGGECTASCGVVHDSGPQPTPPPRADSTRRNHQCPRCPQAFHSRKDMRRHYTVHTDSKPFRCKVCSRRFRRKDNLDRHIRNTHPNFVPATVMDCDENALNIIINDRPPTPAYSTDDKLIHSVVNNEGIQLESHSLLPQEVIENHSQSEKNDNANRKDTDDSEKSDKSYILEANNARQSVIFGPVRKDGERNEKITTQEYGYVHKIQKAHTIIHKDIHLPPIDEKKIIELEHNTSLNNLDIGAPLKNVEVYKKILYMRPNTESDNTGDNEKADNDSKIHWRRKLKLNMVWYV